MIDDHAKEYAQVLSLMKCHDTRKQCWLNSDTQLLNGVHKIGRIPAVMVFGRYQGVMTKHWLLCPGAVVQVDVAFFADADIGVDASQVQFGLEFVFQGFTL